VWHHNIVFSLDICPSPSQREERGLNSRVKGKEANLFLNKRLKEILKGALFFGIYYSGALHLLILILTKFRKKHYAAILFYHRFSSDSSNDYGLPHLDVHEFKKQMRHIKRWYSVVTMDELANRVTKGNPFTSPSVVITIDDGYLNNYTLAYPVLRELDLPAIIYLTTGFIGTNKAPWVDCLINILSVTKAKTLCFPDLLGGEVLDISTQRGERAAITKIFQVMVRLEHKEKTLAMEKLSEILSVKEIWGDDNERKMLNWNEVMEMSRNKISFGAHTVSHPTLSRMELPEAKQEIYESKMEIEARIGCKVRHFAIPNGKIEDFNEELKRYCEEIGVKTVVSTEPGVISAQSDPYLLQRICPSTPIYLSACELARYMFLGKRTVNTE